MESKSGVKNFLSRPLADRQRDSQRLIDKYPGKKPIILQKSKSSEIPAIDKFKYLMPTEMTVSQVINVIRKYFKTDQFDENTALYVIVQHSFLPIVTTTIGELFEPHKDEDGFLYIFYSGENTFGL